jgi:hypothetical protein
VQFAVQFAGELRKVANGNGAVGDQSAGHSPRHADGARRRRYRDGRDCP